MGYCRTFLDVFNYFVDKFLLLMKHIPGCITQSVMSLTADPGVVSSIPVWSHTFVKIDHEIISTVILLLPLIQEGLLSVTNESMCMKYWLTRLIYSQACPGKSVVR